MKCDATLLSRQTSVIVGIPYLVIEKYDASIGGSYPWRFVAAIVIIGTG